MSDKDVHAAIDEIAGKSRDLLAHLEAVKQQSSITLADLEAIQKNEQKIGEQIDSVVRKNQIEKENS